MRAERWAVVTVSRAQEVDVAALHASCVVLRCGAVRAVKNGGVVLCACSCKKCKTTFDERSLALKQNLRKNLEQERKRSESWNTQTIL